MSNQPTIEERAFALAISKRWTHDMSDQETIRTHEPTLRELTAELDGLKDLFNDYCKNHEKLEIERDRRYAERDNANRVSVDAALKAADTLNKANSDSSEKAIQKAETNAEKWRDNSNEWRTAMNDRENKFATKSEVQIEVASLRAAIANLRESRDQGVGTQVGKDDSRNVVLIIIAVIGSLIGMAGFLVMILRIIRL